MADISLTDDLGKSAPNVKIDLKQPSSLLKYAKTEALHLLVFPDFLQVANQKLSQTAPIPISFKLALKQKFQLGITKPEIDLTPGLEMAIRVNATPGSSLFDADPFLLSAKVPDNTGYVSLALAGSLDLGVSGSSGDLSFGFAANRKVSLEYWKAFPLDADQPELGDATGQTISGFVIPGDVEDLKLLNVNDICSASSEGSLKISGSFSVSAAPNPLASVSLPLNAGTVQVKAGAMAGVSASFTISGSYQLRARRIDAATIELSFCKKQGTALKTDLTASAGVAVKFNDTDLLKSLLGAISADPNDDATKKLFAEGGLSADEIATLTEAIKGSLDHSFQASLDLALSRVTDGQAAFQYEVQPALLDAESSAALHAALDGDLTQLTVLENNSEGADIAPGIKLISSIVTKTQKTGVSLTVNLLGLVNYVSLSSLLLKSVVVKDPVSGNLTIADSATGTQINSLVDDLRHGEALRKTMFESLMVTATYRVSNTVQMPALSSHNFHFAFNQGTNGATIADYLNWLVVMKLITQAQADAYQQQFTGGGPSTCLLRTAFDDQACHDMFFAEPGQLWSEDHYRDLGRRAMLSLINPKNSTADRLRFNLLDQHWSKALEIGANVNLGQEMGLHQTDSTERGIITLLIGDVYTIVWWADAMHKAGQAILEMQQFLKSATPATLKDNHEFAQRRDALQKLMGKLLSKSETRFEEPWGLICMFWAAGSAGASAKLVANGLRVIA